ncbi:MAG TPA: cytochrome c oxidase assembly factor Coa1 family protein [Candidatus Solibacter sp.]|nr:cytochrome c oxidase assembly factor Coa1 family protein [Candidatus Solibacter sp.]
MSHAPVHDQYLPSRKSWFARNLAWFLPVIIVFFIVTFVAGVVSLVLGVMKSSEPYQHAVQIAIHDPKVINQLGDPVVPGWYATGSINLSGNSGTADLRIPLQGPARKGSLYVIANKHLGRWSYDEIQVRIEGETAAIDLLRGPTIQPGEQR